MTLEEERIFGVDGLAALANLSSVYDCESEWASYVNKFNITKHPIVISDTIAFTKNHNIFNYISKDNYDYYSTYGEFALKDFKIKGDFNDDGYIDQLVFFSFCHHEKGTAVNTIWQAEGEDFPWREYQGFGLVTKYHKYTNLHLIKIGLSVPDEILAQYKSVSKRLDKELKLFKEN